MPFSAAGAVIVMLAAVLVGHWAWAQHQRALATADEINARTLLTTAASVQADLQRLARYATYGALWDVGKRAGDFQSREAREHAIERLAAERFVELSRNLPRVYKLYDPRIDLELADGLPKFDLRRESGGYAVARVGLPQTRIKVRSWDNSFKLALTCENFDVFVDSRYFLLEELMDRFIEGVRGLDDIGSTWWAAEYATAWAQALTGRVRLSESRSRAFFELAWARHEYDTFGSSDYSATSAKLIGIVTPDIVLGRSEPKPPLSAAEIEMMKSYIDECIFSLDAAKSELIGIKGGIERARRHASDGLENLVRSDLKSIIEGVEGIRAHVKETKSSFEGLLNYTMGLSNSELSLKLRSGLTESTGLRPALGEQISSGVEGVYNKLARLENSVRNYLQRVGENSASLGFLGELEAEIKRNVRDLLTETPPRRLSGVEYPGPENYVFDPGRPPEPTTREIEYHLIDGSNASLGTMRVVLVNAKNDFERLRGLAGIAGEVHEKIDGARIGEGLVQKLFGESRPSLGPLDREYAYELMPPPPIDSKPGISVFHDFHITDVRYERRDPLGRLLGPAAPPTPIPLWFIGLTLYWAQWEISLEVGDGAVEKIFDFPNPVLPREHSLHGGSFIAHKPLAYRYEMPGMRFSFQLLILLPWKNFAVSEPEMTL